MDASTIEFLIFCAKQDLQRQRQELLQYEKDMRLPATVNKDEKDRLDILIKLCSVLMKKVGQ